MASKARRLSLRFERGRAAQGAASPYRRGIEYILRDAMATHRFAVGQAVRFSPDRDQEQEREHTRGRCSKSFACSPKRETRFSTNVKSEIDGKERVIRVDQLAGA